MRIRKGDVVKVLTGDDRGLTGRVLRVMLDEDRIVVEGVNRVFRHVRPSQRNPRGGRVSKEMPIHVSNVMLVNSENGKAGRVGVSTNEAGEKMLVFRNGGKVVRKLRSAKPEKRA